MQTLEKINTHSLDMDVEGTGHLIHGRIFKTFFFKKSNRELKSCFSRQEHFLLFQRTGAQSSAPTSADSQLSLTPDLGDLTTSSGLCGYLHALGVYTLAHTHMYTLFFLFF